MQGGEKSPYHFGSGGVGAPPTGSVATEGSAVLQGAGRRTRRATDRFLELGIPTGPAKVLALAPTKGGEGQDGAETSLRDQGGGRAPAGEEEWRKRESESWKLMGEAGHHSRRRGAEGGASRYFGPE
jgi:hypothetical protein